MTHPLRLDPQRFFPSDPSQRRIAAELFGEIETLPIVSPHGHTDPAWFAGDAPFEDAVSLLLWPDHYLLRMLMSVGVTLESLGLQPSDGGPIETDRRAIWQRFAEHYHVLPRHPLAAVARPHLCGSVRDRVRLEAPTADLYYDTIGEKLAQPEFRPRALFERFGIEVLATTDRALDSLEHHRALGQSGWRGRVIPTFRPDEVLDPTHPDFQRSLEDLAVQTGEDVSTWPGYLAALCRRREFFREHGATATDHGHSSARTACFTRGEMKILFDRILLERMEERELGRLSRPDAYRNGAYVVRRRHGHAAACRAVAQSQCRAVPPFWLAHGRRSADGHRLCAWAEAVARQVRQRSQLYLGAIYARRVHLFAGAGAARGHLSRGETGAALVVPRFAGRHAALPQSTTETAGFYNTAGFNDDTRAFFSIPARHDLARRMDCAYLAELVATHRLEIDEASELAHALAYGLAKRTYKL